MVFVSGFMIYVGFVYREMLEILSRGDIYHQPRDISGSSPLQRELTNKERSKFLQDSS
jgi:hypothetical protein